MNYTPEEQPAQPATARAEALLGTLGRRIDLFTSQATQRVQNVAASIREEADRIDQPSTADETKAHSPASAHAEVQGKLAMERAEDVVDRLAHRMSYYIALTGYQIQRATARLREEGEDIWAEAQHMHQQRTRPPD